MGNNFAKGFINLMLPTLKDRAKSELRAAIQEPTESKNKFNVFTGTAAWRNFEIEKQGKIAIVTKKADRDFSVKLSQVPDGHWKIVQFISNDLKPSLPVQLQ